MSHRNNSLRRNRLSTPPNQGLQPVAIEGTYAKIAAITQALMLILVAFGYWYTVLPVYQKSLLDEDIAKKTLELNKSTKDLETLRASVTVKERELASLLQSVEGYRSDSAKARSEASAAKSSASRAKFDSEVARAAALTRYASLRSQSLSLFWGELLRYCVGSSVTTDLKLTECVDSRSKKSEAFQQLEIADGRSVIELLRVSIAAHRDSWNKAFQDYANERRQLEAKVSDLKQAFEAEKSQRKTATQQDRMDALGADYRSERDISSATSAILLLDIKFPPEQQKILRAILNIKV